jgi:hypothetical protein
MSDVGLMLMRQFNILIFRIPFNFISLVRSDPLLSDANLIFNLQVDRGEYF